MNIAQRTSRLAWGLASRERRAPQACRPPPGVVTLGKGSIHRIERPAGWVVACVAGSVWLTHDGDPRDIVLAAGERHVADRASRLLVQALEPAAIEWAPAGAAAGRTPFS